jgi:hypothetical protein
MEKLYTEEELIWEDKDEQTRPLSSGNPPPETSTDYDEECSDELWAVTHTVKVSCSMMFNSCCCVFGSRLDHS